MTVYFPNIASVNQSGKMKKFLENRTLQILAISIGIVYLWFGALKFFPGLSPAEDLASETIYELTFGLIPHGLAMTLLAIWEVLIGVCFLCNYVKKPILVFTLIHMVLTFSVLVIFPNLSFQEAPFSLSIIGQYVIKNLVIISAILILYQSNQSAAPALSRTN